MHIGIVSQNHDRYYLQGVECILKEALGEYSDKRFIVKAYDHINKITLPLDILFIQMVKGGEELCQPLLCDLTTKCRVYTFVDERSRCIKASSPEWLRGVIQIQSRQAVQQLKQQLCHTWAKKRSGSEHTTPLCERCKRLELTDAQRRIAGDLIKGISLEEISLRNQKSYASVVAQKWLIKNKFGLHSDSELLTLLDVLDITKGN